MSMYVLIKDATTEKAGTCGLAPVSRARTWRSLLKQCPRAKLAPFGHLRRAGPKATADSGRPPSPGPAQRGHH
jgi:hypothetical protein